MKKAVDNKYTKKFLKEQAEKSDIVYFRTKTEFFMKAFWIVAVGVIFFVNFHLLDSAQLHSHFFSFVSGVFAIKGYQLVEPYLDVAEEAGLIVKKEDYNSTDLDSDEETSLCSGCKEPTNRTVPLESGHDMPLCEDCEEKL